MAILVTVAIERWGGKLGGLLGTLPSTMVPAAVGIYLQSPDVASYQESMAATPVGMLLSALFLWLWRVLPPRLPQGSLRRRLALMILLSLSAWSLAAAATVIGARVSLDLGLSSVVLGWGGAALIAGAGLWATWKNVPAPRGKKRVGAGTLLARAVLAALAIGAAIVLARVGGPIASGVAAVFPAIFMTTMVSLWLSQGEAVQAGAVGPMMLGSTSVAAFALFAAWTLPNLGIVPGCVVAWLGAALLVTLPAWLWLQRRAAVSEAVTVQERPE